jgi:hypothetical protein
MRLVTPSSREGAGALEGERPVGERREAVREPVVDHRCRQGTRVERGTGRAARCGPAGKLRRDDRPGRVVVATGEVEAAQARPGPGLHEGPDSGAGVVEDDREVR